MNLIKFNTNTSCKLDSPTLVTGSLCIIEPTLGSLISFGNVTSTGYTNVVMQDLHTSLDEYVISTGAVGFNGQVRSFKGLSPTEEVYYNTFQNERSITSGTEVMYLDFEGGTVTGCELTVSGSSITVSGLVNDTSMDGNYYIGLNATANSFLMVKPTDPATSGITCGRAIWLTKTSNYSSTSALTRVPIFAFMRQNDTMTSPCYKVSMENDETDQTRWRLGLYAENLLTSTSTYTDITPASVLDLIHIDFSINSTRNAYRNLWTMVEWEALDNAMLFNLYYLVAGSNQLTIQQVKDAALFVGQYLYTGTTSGANFYTTTTGGVAWVLATDTNTASIGFDNLYLETLPSLPKKGLNSLHLLQATVSGVIRPFAALNPYATGPNPPEGSLNYATYRNPLVYAKDAWYNSAGGGYASLLRSWGGTSSSKAVNIYEFIEPTASGITKGVIRCAFKLYTNYVGYAPKIGFSFLRQGNLVNSNCYTVDVAWDNGNGYWEANLRKGTVYTANFDSASDFNGTILSTATDLFADNNKVCLEVRWEVVSPSRTDIELKLCNLSQLVSYEADYMASSPGNVDYLLTQILAYSDLSSPYTTTSAVPLVTLQHTNESPQVYQLELRSAKY